MATIKRREGGTNPTTVIRREYSTAFSPRSIAGCAVWLDAAQDTTTIGSYVTSLPDRSGNGATLSPYSANTIRLTGNSLNGYPVYNFGTGMATNASFFWGTTFTQFVIVKGSGNWLSCTFDGSAYNNFIFAGNWALAQVAASAGANTFAVNDSVVGEGTSVFTTTTGGTSAWTIFCLGYSAGSTTLSNYTLNGTPRTSLTGTAASGTPPNYQLWLNGRGGTAFDTSLVAEYIHYNSALTSTQRQQVESYLAQKWGLTGSLPPNHQHFTQPTGKPNTVTNPTPGLFPVLKPIPFSPLSVTPLLWLDASQSSSFTFASANNISVWADRSGYGNNATQPTAGIQPTYTTNTVNLSGTQWFAVNLDFVAGHDFSAFIVLNNTNYTNIYGAITGGNGSSSLHNGFSSSGAYRVNYWGNDYYPGITAAYRAGNKNLINIDWVNTGGVGKSVRANATLEGSVGQTGTVSAMSGGGTIGNVVSQGILSGTIFEIIFILDTTITTINRNKLEGYLAWKWGIQSYLPAGHPYLSAPP